MRILIANDDGIDAPGIALLRRAAARVASDIWVVAPTRKWTAASHHLSFDRDLTLTRREPQVYALDGTPADCVVAAMTVLFRDGDQPDLVLAGVNDGRNAAEDAAYSGTLSIAREASFWKLPAIGFSRAKGGTAEEGDVAALTALIEALWRMRAEWVREGTFLSVNLPKALPAEAGLAGIGRDKIAGAADIVSEAKERIVWRIRRGRPRSSRPGDENSLIDSGRIAIVRHCWSDGAALDERFASALNAGLKQPEG
ncbi:5'/3'-nucleotidase SurE [Bosea sp. (in: a-proteobacteria)]|uniref:5'/3'-nucleotidase SurE n=1 Tax=Bosea sp. (in: a-proteobacteria) TaxID=1871050 RepID=UPI002622E081|nr:5'/3'-nucleotidase SurE [Bosea sp. (in: a-proteobacteria)]MCO5090139.1 5'/3'-nucleotidase SurE [Bosea sp. (in: a-proteobacteria)]